MLRAGLRELRAGRAGGAGNRAAGRAMLSAVVTRRAGAALSVALPVAPPAHVPCVRVGMRCALGGAAESAPAGAPASWSADEVQRWFEAHNGGQWAKYAPKFAKLDGAEMSALSKEDFLRFADSPYGSAIFNDWRAAVGAAGAWPRRCAPLRCSGAHVLTLQTQVPSSRCSARGGRAVEGTAREVTGRRG